MNSAQQKVIKDRIEELTERLETAHIHVRFAEEELAREINRRNDMEAELAALRESDALRYTINNVTRELR